MAPDVGRVAGVERGAEHGDEADVQLVQVIGLLDVVHGVHVGERVHELLNDYGASRVSRDGRDDVLVVPAGVRVVVRIGVAREVLERVPGVVALPLHVLGRETQLNHIPLNYKPVPSTIHR